MKWLFGGPRKKYPLIIPENRLNYLAKWWSDLPITQMKAGQQAPGETRHEKIDFGQITHQTQARIEINFKRFPKDAVPLGELQRLLSEQGFPEATVEEFAYYHHLSLEDPRIETDIQLHFVRWGVMRGVLTRLTMGAGFPNEPIYKLMQLMREARQAEGRTEIPKSFLILESFIPGNLTDVLLYDRDLMQSLKRGNMILSPEDVRKFELRTQEYETRGTP